MALGSLNLKVSKKDFQDRIQLIQQRMDVLDDVIQRYGRAKQNLDQFIEEGDSNYQAMVERIDVNVEAAKKAYNALKETKASMEETVELMGNMGKEVKETLDAATDAAKEGIEAAIKISALL